VHHVTVSARPVSQRRAASANALCALRQGNPLVSNILNIDRD